MLPVPARRAGVIVPSPTTLDNTPMVDPEGFRERTQAMSPPTKNFGSVLRELRRAGGYSLRGFAATVGVSPAYVSVIEQGKVCPPAVGHVLRMAYVLREDPDRLIALSGRMPEDVAEIIRKQPEAIHALLRAVKGLRAEELGRIAAGIEKRRKTDKRGPIARVRRKAPGARSARGVAPTVLERRP